MSDHHVYKKVELVGSSRTTIEDAIENALVTASESLELMDWFEQVKDVEAEVKSRKVSSTAGKRKLTVKRGEEQLKYADRVADAVKKATEEGKDPRAAKDNVSKPKVFSEDDVTTDEELWDSDDEPAPLPSTAQLMGKDAKRRRLRRAMRIGQVGLQIHPDNSGFQSLVAAGERKEQMLDSGCPMM